MKCRACGRDLEKIQHTTEDLVDGLCSRWPREGTDRRQDLKGCYGSFVDFAQTKRGVDIRHRLPGFTHAMVDWTRAEVQVCWDEWLELGTPRSQVTYEEMPF